MNQTQMFITQTFVDEEWLQYYLAWTFFEHANLRGSDIWFENVSDDILKRTWESHLARNRILIPEFTSKDDFRDTLLSLYEGYVQPTLLFLGNLNDYSLPLQEGMLRLLEEPPHNLHIILLAHTRNEVLPTIISRSTVNTIPSKIVLAHLNQVLLNKVKKSLPVVGEFVKKYIGESSNGFNNLVLPDVSKVERNELDFWLWQMASYITQYYIQSPSEQLARLLSQIHKAQALNQSNLQKKFVLGALKMNF